MVFWLVALLITAAVAAPIVLAIAKAQDSSVSGAQSDMAVYKDQLAEVDRDLARGLLTEAEAEAARTEVSRRLLDADRRLSQEESKTALTLPAIVGVLIVLVAGGGAIYARMGAPGYPDLPLTQRLSDIAIAAENRPGQLAAEADAALNMPDMPQGDAQFQALMAQLRTTVEQRPDDLRGLQLLAENEARLGNFKEAREAQERVLEIKGDDATELDLLQAIDIMVFGAGGYVSPEAEALIRRVAGMSPDSGPARYYSGLTLAQNGRPDLAFSVWQRLLDDSRPEAPWVPLIQSELPGLAAAAGITNFTPSGPALSGPRRCRSGGRRGHVGGRPAGDDRGHGRRACGPIGRRRCGPPSEWARLITALGVLGDTDRAAAILSEARQVFGESTDALALLDDGRSAGRVWNDHRRHDSPARCPAPQWAVGRFGLWKPHHWRCCQRRVPQRCLANRDYIRRKKFKTDAEALLAICDARDVVGLVLGLPLTHGRLGRTALSVDAGVCAQPLGPSPTCPSGFGTNVFQRLPPSGPCWKPTRRAAAGQK